MYYFIQKFHSGWAYLALLLLVLAVFNALVGKTNKKEFSPKDRKTALLALIATHIQLLVGLVLYFVSPLGLEMLGQLKQASLRLTALEHPLINIIALVFITMGWSRHKKASSNEAKFKTIALFYGIGLILILSRIPWNLWF
jgi:NADH:ubiquinone oxidoreductase subunit 2 (subunit N)